MPPRSFRTSASDRSVGVPGSDTERFELSGDVFRRLVDWVEATDLVAVEVPSEVASVVHEMCRGHVDRVPER